MLLKFDWVSVDRARALGLDDMLALNWEEVEDHKEAAPFDPDWAAYKDLDRRGVLKLGILTLDGRLIGYNIFFLNKPLHHRSTLWAISDLVYIDPTYRLGRNALYMLTESERLLREMGARIILYGVKLSPKPGRGSVGQLLGKLGHSTFDQSWSKEL